MGETKVEQRVDRVKSYVKEKRGWRPARRTVVYLSVMLVALLLAAFLLPRLLPGNITESEALLGRGGGLDVVPLGGAPARRFVDPPPPGQGYSCWALSGSREEVLLGFFETSGGQVGKVSVQSRSAYSGRLLVEWPLEPQGDDPRIRQLGFLPRHNQVWYLADGRIWMIDIKSSRILQLPFRGPEGKGSIEAPEDVSRAAFSPLTGRLAYLEDGRLNLVTGLASSREQDHLESETVLAPGITPDARGRPVDGTVEDFTWIDDERLAVIIRHTGDRRPVTPVYAIDVGGPSPVIEMEVGAPEGGFFTAIDHAPSGGGYAILFSRGEPDSSGSATRDSIRVFDESGRVTGNIGLPGAGWRSPLEWGP